VVVFIFLFGLGVKCVFGHEVRPAYLELHEERTGEFGVLWKTPMLGDVRLSLNPAFSGDARVVTKVNTHIRPGAAVQQWTLRAPTLRGQTLRIVGLETTMTDVLARIEFADGSEWVHRFTGQAPSVTVPTQKSGWSIAGVYLKLGIEHILLGIDHLLFVLALLIVARGAARLVKTVTAFTVAHSITLALATLGIVHVPSQPVEAAIALSIVFVAAEILHRRQGREGVTAHAPWIIAFGFGLLHGFGFAGALSAVGLPEAHIPMALLFFNVGVETGQLLFIAAVIALAALVRRISGPLPRWTELVPPYAIGSIAMFWVVQRVAAF
jgi:hydrogenase/urease accessory protein HupE